MSKTINSATVYFAGDRSVGIPSASFDVQLFITPDDFGNGPDETAGFATALTETRKKIFELYEFINGDAPTWVRFDFEIQAENDADNEAWDESERLAEERNERYLEELLENERRERIELELHRIADSRCPCGEDH